MTASRPIDAVRPLDRTPSRVYRTMTHQVTAGGREVGVSGVWVPRRRFQQTSGGAQQQLELTEV